MDGKHLNGRGGIRSDAVLMWSCNISLPLQAGTAGKGLPHYDEVLVREFVDRPSRLSIQPADDIGLREHPFGNHKILSGWSVCQVTTLAIKLVLDSLGPDVVRSRSRAASVIRTLSGQYRISGELITNV